MKLAHRFALLVLAIVCCCRAANAAIHTEAIEYKDGDVVLEGYLAYDDAVSAARPGVLICHQWMGLSEHEKGRAEELAKLGYVAFALDMYGKGKLPANPQEAGARAGQFKKDRALTRARAIAGLDALRADAHVDKTKLAAIGYCFGGMVALELARSGAAVRGIVSFHGSLDNPTPDDAKNIKGKVLVQHGADDPYVTMEQVQAFMNEMRNAKVDWEFVAYGGAVHAFTQPAAGNDNSEGAAYNAAADRRSWMLLQAFITELFAA